MATTDPMAKYVERSTATKTGHLIRLGMVSGGTAATTMVLLVLLGVAGVCSACLRALLVVYSSVNVSCAHGRMKRQLRGGSWLLAMVNEGGEVYSENWVY